MKIVFLDIDGVLNNEDDAILRLGKDSPLYGAHYCPVLVTKLNRILEETGAKIVLSSTWRLGLSLTQAATLIDDMEITGEVVGITEETWGEPHIFRGNEIHKWILDNESLIGSKYYDYKDYLILDDDSDMLYWQRNNFVQTNGLKGLTDSNVMESIAILNGERGDSCGVNEYVIKFDQ